MENFIVSARKYRPSTFESVVGQRSITTTLKNAIKTSHLAHAYLFCGPRGVGKTTCARIFAKTINCSQLSPEIEPCNECQSCKSFNENKSYNIHELDAASNNSVEDIRNLIDQVRIPPQMGNHSVYIIDEVHMLSTQAFNAFLKTLEEPPRHATFILATTEKHKILPTILSRCQIFDFNRIRIEDIANHLAYVAKSENVTVEHEALTVIAQKAEGGMRDALSYFDQIVSFSGGEISYKKVIDNLNILDYDYYFKLVNLFVKNKVFQTYLIFDEILSKGFDGHHFISGLSSHFRDILVCKDSSTVDLLEAGASIKSKYLEQAELCPQPFLLEALNICNECDVQYRNHSNQRLLVELTLLRLSNITNKKKKPDIGDPGQKEEKEEGAAKPEVKEKQIKPKYDTSISIKKAIEGGGRKTEVNEPSEKQYEQVEENESFTQVQLESAWLKMIENYKQSARFYNILKTYKPLLIDEINIEIELSNSLQEEALQDKKADILHHLKKILHNTSIQLATKVKANQPYKKAPTVKEKFDILLEKNPELKNLKDKFDLDF